MIRGIRIVALNALIVALPLVAACSAVSSTARGTPSASAVGKGPVTTNTGALQGSLSKCAPGSQSEALVSFGLKMINATSGWALGQCSLGNLPSFPQGSTLQCYWPQNEFEGIVRTDDGAKTWTDVSPPSVPNRSFQHAEFFLDANHAWVGEVWRTADACVSGITTYMTADGGTTWKQGGTVAIKSESPTSGVFDVPGPTHAMDFIDQQHGWMLVDATAANPQPGAMVDPTLLYSTADGGLHWNLVATNPGKSLLSSAGCPSSIYAPGSDAVFTTPTSGWLQLACPPGILVLRSTDSGRRWTPTPLPCACQVWEPEYLDASHIVITGTQGSPVLLATQDGGASWAQRAVPKAAMTFFSFIDPNDGWMVGIEQLPKSYNTVVYRTRDGGSSWSQLGRPSFATSTSSPNLYYPIQDVQFIDSNTGFVILGQEAGAQGATTSDPTAPEFQIIKTVDGGQSWNVVLGQIAAMPCSANYTQLGFGNGPLWPAKMASTTTGWATGGLRTTDGGLHWRDVSPAALREGSTTQSYPPGYVDFYLDADHAWQAAVYGSQTSCTDHVTTFATANGGKNWQKSDPIALKLQAGYRTGPLQLGFTSRQTGWLWIPTGPQTPDFPFDFSASDVYLYSTSDGGLTWRSVSSLSDAQVKDIAAATGSQNCKPRLGQIQFSSASVGWVSTICTDSKFLVTRDSGANWSVFSFPIPSSLGCPCFVGMPNFVDEGHGMVVVSSETAASAGTLLTTSDGGKTWRQAAAPGTGGVVSLDLLSPTNAFALVTPPGWTKLSKTGLDLYRSEDSGGSWTLIRTNVPASWPPGFFQFIDLNHGFESNINGATEFLTTADGGMTWKSITPAIVA